MTEFEAYKPFQYRILLPVTIRAIEFLTPNSIEGKINDLTSNILENRVGSGDEVAENKSEKLTGYGYRIVIYFLINISALFVFLITIKYLAGALNILPEKICDLIPFGMLIALPIYFNFGNFMYDFSHLFLFTLSLLFLYKQRWLKYVIVFSLALLNKETAVLLVIVFIVNHYRTLSRVTFYKLLGIQIGIFIVIKFVLYLVFLDNAGGTVEYHLAWNLNHMSHLKNYFDFETIGKGMLFPVSLGIPLPRGLNIPMFVFILLVIAFNWREIPLFLRKSLAYIPVLFILGLTMGHINELRAYYDALPIVYLSVMIGAITFIDKNKIFKIREED